MREEQWCDGDGIGYVPVSVHRLADILADARRGQELSVLLTAL
jgi:hypothetical protein